MKIFHKTFPKRKAGYVRREVGLQMVAVKYGLSPAVVKTDYETFIDMVDLEEMSVGDIYGDDINEIPPKILAAMWSHLYTLYHVCGIEYIDVWPRNFIEKNGRVWIIDFGDARELTYRRNERVNDYLQEILEAGTITHWNEEFA